MNRPLPRSPCTRVKEKERKKKKGLSFRMERALGRRKKRGGGKARQTKEQSSFRKTEGVRGRFWLKEASALFEWARHTR